MDGSGNGREGLEDDGRDMDRRRRKVRAIKAAAAVIIVDIIVLASVVPWADELTNNPSMSWGYIVTFFLAFFNVIIFLGLLAYGAHQDSYPSDHWK